MLQSPSSQHIQKKIKTHHHQHQTMTNSLDGKILNRFSRQNAALGADTTAKLIKMKVLVYGLRGVGSETCKNLALQGAGGITLIDSNIVEPKDVGVNFFFQENDVGKVRSAVVAPRLKELNPLCEVQVSEAINNTIVSQHSAVVVTQYMNLDELIQLNEFCRARNISFFYSMVACVTSTIFVDHGPNHKVHDFDGERPIQKLITQISAIPDSPEETLIRYETPEGQEVEIGTEDVDEAVVLRYAKYATIELQPMAAFAGGVLAQEVVKCSGKFTPIPGFMHFSAAETLPSEENPGDLAPRGLPQDELASVFGWEFVEKLGNLRYFMVGCGALGCELLKNFALNSICCGEKGKLTVTDADRIELSNLSRQFLFREHNVGQAKSKAAATMVQIMNPRFNIEPLEQFVGPNSEDVFNDEFWESLSGVCNALDNMEARLYVDRQCVKYEKPLLESGTMGTKGNVETVCPFKTRTYGEGGNAAESGGVPMCTLRNFPHITEHCIEWARDQFEYMFVQIGQKLESFLSDPEKFQEKLKEKASVEAGAALFEIRSLISFAKCAFNPSIGSAAQLSFDIFHYLFRDKILDLQTAFPKDYRIVDEKTGQDKGPFWNEKKRYPTVAEFNVEDSAHTEFLLSCTCLFSVMVGLIAPKQEDDDHWLKDYRDPAWIRNIASGLTIPAYIQAPVNTEDDKTVTGTKKADHTEKQQILGIIEQLLQDLRAVTASSSTPSPSSSSNTNATSTFSFEPSSFEKDDDLNFHIDFVTSAANLRCDNYSLKRTDFQNCKVIAGRIIPAILTTTAAVCGLVTMELFKLVQDKDTDAYMLRAIGLGGYSYTSFTADPPNKVKTKTEVIQPDLSLNNLPADAFDETGKIKLDYCEKVTRRVYPENHSVWDKLVAQGSWTLRQFKEWFEEKHSLKLMKWDFIYGYVNKVDEETNKKFLNGVSTSIYPPAVVLDYSLLPPLDLSLAQASAQIMRNRAAQPTQQYLSLWKACKEKGEIPPQPTSENLITESTTLREIVLRMSRLAEAAAENKEIELKAISKAESRKFVVIPSSEAPMCMDLESGDTIETLCAIKILLNE